MQRLYKRIGEKTMYGRILSVHKSTTSILNDMKRVWLFTLLLCLTTMALATDTTGIVAYSDTAVFNDTCTASVTATSPSSHIYSFSASTDDWDMGMDGFLQMLSGFKNLVFSNGWLFALALLFFIALPFTALILIILVIVLLLRKNKAPKAVQNTIGEEHQEADRQNKQNDTCNRAEELRQLGVRRCCIGAGLLLLCIFIDSKLGMGIGCLLMCIGISHIINGRNKHHHE